MKRLAFKIVAHAGLLTLLCAYAAGQTVTGSQQPPPAPAPAVDAGTITGSTYVNDYFGMRLTIPEGWNVSDAQGKQKLKESGQKQLTIPDRKVQEVMDATVERTAVLVMASKPPQKDSGTGNAILICGAEPVPKSVIKTLTGSYYLTEMKKLFQYGTPTPLVEEDVSSERINGADFGVMTLKLESPVGTVRQKYWVIPKRDYALFCISTYTNEADRQVMSNAISSIKFQ